MARDQRPRTADNWFDIKQLAPDLYGIAEFGHTEEVISFLWIGRERALLIDSGMGLFSIRQAVEQLSDKPCDVINTHSHFDHIGGNHEFERVALYDHPMCRKIAQAGLPAERLAPLASNDHFWGSRPSESPHPYTLRPFPNATYFNDSEAVHPDFPDLIALHTPGHSSDSVCFYDPSRGWLFAGDLLYDGPIYIQKNGGLPKYRRSIQRILGLENVTRIFTSHNAFEFKFEQLKQIDTALKTVTTESLSEPLILSNSLRLIS